MKLKYKCLKLFRINKKKQKVCLRRQDDKMSHEAHLHRQLTTILSHYKLFNILKRYLPVLMSQILRMRY